MLKLQTAFLNLKKNQFKEFSHKSKIPKGNLSENNRNDIISF